MNWITSLFSSPKIMDTAANVVEMGMKGIDALVFTEEEKAKMSKETFELWLEMQRVIKDESTVRSFTRRILSIMILGVYLTLAIFGAVIYKFDPGWGQIVFDVVKHLSTLAWGVGAFYFGVHLLRAQKKE